VNSLPANEGLTFTPTTATVPKEGSVYVVTTLAGKCQAIATATTNPSRIVIKTVVP